MSRLTDNFCELRHALRRLRLLEITALVGLSTLTSQSYADIHYGASATADYEYDSNVFDLPGGTYAPGATRRSDWFQAYGGTLQVDDLIDQDKLYATVTGKDYRYDYFTQLDHAEYNGDVGLKWKSGSVLDGQVDVSRIRQMVPFADITQTQLSVSTTQREQGQIGWVFIPDWRLEGLIAYDTVDEPEVNAPELYLKEKTGQLSLKYIGVAGLSVGLSDTYLRGAYSGALAFENPNYTQDTLQLVVAYRPTAASTIVGQAGYTRRTSDSEANAQSAPTGSLTYTDQITPKTSLNFQIHRDVSNYIANGGAAVDTGGLGGVTWQATYRLSVSVDYNYVHQLLPDQGTTVNPNRIDKYQFYDLKFDYQPLRWLWLQPYLKIQDRSSNDFVAQFNSNTIGVNFNLLWHCPNNRCSAEPVGIAPL